MRSRKITNLDKIHLLEKAFEQLSNDIKQSCIERELLDSLPGGLTEYGKGQLIAYGMLLRKVTEIESELKKSGL
jgi:hypothetical protein